VRVAAGAAGKINNRRAHSSPKIHLPARAKKPARPEQQCKYGLNNLSGCIDLRPSGHTGHYLHRSNGPNAGTGGRRGAAILAIGAVEN